MWRRHIDHIHQFNVSPQQTDNVVETLPSDQDGTSQPFPNVDSQPDAASEPDMTNSEASSEPNVILPPRYPKRVTKPPDRYEPS